MLMNTLFDLCLVTVIMSFVSFFEKFDLILKTIFLFYYLLQRKTSLVDGKHFPAQTAENVF